MKLIETNIHGWPHPMMLPESTLVKSQKRVLPRLNIAGTNEFVTPVVRWDDQCNNGHNSFSVTGTLWEKKKNGQIYDVGGGCIHDYIIKSHPELEHLIKWHLVSSDGPMHYLSNTIYHAGDRDCNGLLKGESRQIRNGGTGKLAWELKATAKLEQYIDSDTPPAETATLRYVPWCRIGEGKQRELDHARSSACWPEATDEQLCLPPEELKALLIDRLPAMMVEFYNDVTNFGMVY